MKTLPLRETSRASGCAQTHTCTHRHTNTQTHKHKHTPGLFQRRGRVDEAQDAQRDGDVPLLHHQLVAQGAEESVQCKLCG